MQIIGAGCINIDIRLILRLRELKDSLRKYWWVILGFRYALVLMPIFVLSR